MNESRSRIPVIPRNGIYLPELDLHLDAHCKVGFGFVSHAHADHYARHSRILCSRRTAELIRVRYGIGRSELEALDFHEPLELEGYRIVLIPAGHILGSSQIHLTRLSDGASLLYTGDFKVKPGLAAEEPEFMHADTLVMETTFGLPKYEFPDPKVIHEDVRDFVRFTLADGEVPVLMGCSLGKAQELLCAVTELNIPVLMHPAVFKMTQVYDQLADFPMPGYRKFSKAEDPGGYILLFPPNVVRSEPLQNIGNIRTAVASGWGMDSSAKYRYGVDFVFPLSDHADYPDLIECVEEVNPRLVLTMHGYAAEFAADLRRRGVEAWCLKGDDQLELFVES